jgi:Holliday junction resolvase RusA-like endonuclease
VMVFENERGRDDDNYATGSLKAARDALTGRAWPDDTPEYVVLGEVTFRIERGRGKARMLVTITEIGV